MTLPRDDLNEKAASSDDLGVAVTKFIEKLDSYGLNPVVTFDRRWVIIGILSKSVKCTYPTKAYDVDGAQHIAEQDIPTGVWGLGIWDINSLYSRDDEVFTDERWSTGIQMGAMNATMVTCLSDGPSFGETAWFGLVFGEIVRVNS